jgi:hypothetical protein
VLNGAVGLYMQKADPLWGMTTFTDGCGFGRGSQPAGARLPQTPRQLQARPSTCCATLSVASCINAIADDVAAEAAVAAQCAATDACCHLRGRLELLQCLRRDFHRLEENSRQARRKTADKAPCEIGAKMATDCYKRVPCDNSKATPQQNERCEDNV